MGKILSDEQWKSANGVYVTDPDTGNREWYSAGNMTQPMVNVITPGYENLARGNDKLYKQADGSYANTVDASLASITLDTDKNSPTYGKVSVVAPRSFLESEYYNGSNGNMGYKDVLNSLSEGYRANPDYAFAMEKDGEKKTAEQWIKDLNPDFAKVASSYYDADRDRINANYVSNTSYNMPQWMKRNQIATSYKPTNEDLAKGIIDTSSDSTIISIPKWFGAKYLKDVNGYDMEKGVISKGDFVSNFWNSNKLSDEDMVKIGLDLQRRAESDPSSSTDMDEFASTQALYDTLRGVSINKPQGASASKEDRGTRQFGIGSGREGLANISDTANAIFTGSAYGIGYGAASINNALFQAVGWLFDTTSDMLNSINPNYETGQKTMTHTLGDWSEQALSNADEWFNDAQNKLSFVSPNVASVKAISASVGEMLSEMVMTTAIIKGVSGVLAAGSDVLLESIAISAGEKATTDAARIFAEDAMAQEGSLLRLPSNTPLGTTVSTELANNGGVLIEGASIIQSSQTGGEFASLVSKAANGLRESGFTDAVAKYAEMAAKYGASARQASTVSGLALRNSTVNGALLNSIFETVTGAATAGKNIANAYRVAQSLSELSTITYIGAALSDHNTFNRIMTSKEITESDKAYLLSNAITSFAWYSAGVGLGLFGSKTGVTKDIQRYVNTKVSPKLASMVHYGNRFNAKVNDFTDWMRSVVKGGSSDASTYFRESMVARDATSTGSKAWSKANRVATSAYKNIVRQTEANLMDMAWQTLSSAKTTSEVANAKIVVESIDNMITDINQGSDIYLSAMYDKNYNPIYAEANNNFMESYSGLVISTQEVKGLTPATEAMSVDKSGIINGVAGSLPVEVNDYVRASLDLPQRLDDYISSKYPGTLRTDPIYQFDFAGTTKSTTRDPLAGNTKIVITLDDIREWNSSIADRVESDLSMINKLQDMANTGIIPQKVIDDAKALSDRALRIFQIRTGNGILTQGLAPDIPGYNAPIINKRDLEGVISSGVFGQDGMDYFPSSGSTSDIPIDVKLGARFESDYARLQNELEYHRGGGKIDHYPDVAVTTIGKQMDDAYQMSRANVFSTIEKNLPGVFTDVQATSDEVLGAKYAKERKKVTDTVKKMAERYSKPSTVTDTDMSKAMAEDMPINERASISILPEEKIDASFYGNPVKQSEKNAETIFQKDLKITEQEKLEYSMFMPLDERIAVSNSLGDEYVTLYRGQSGLDDFHHNTHELDTDKNLVGSYWLTKDLSYAGEHGGDILVLPIKQADILSYDDLADMIYDADRKINNTEYMTKLWKDNPEEAQWIEDLSTRNYREILKHENKSILEINPDGLPDLNRFVGRGSNKSQLVTFPDQNPDVFIDSQKRLANTQYVEDMAKISNVEDALAKRQGIYSDIVELLGEDYGTANTDIMLQAADDTANTLIKDLQSGNHGQTKAILSAEVTGKDTLTSDLVADYRSAQYLLGGESADGEKMVLRKDIRDSLKKGIDETNNKRIEEAAKRRDRDAEAKGKLRNATVQKLKADTGKDTDTFIDAVERSLQSKLSEYGGMLKELGSDIPDNNTTLMDELSRLVEDVTGKQQSADVITTVDGRIIRVDPMLADFYNYKPVTSEPGGLQKIRQFESKIFRYGTTTINPSSIINQYFKDPISAIVNGNLDVFIYRSHDDIAEQFGEEFADTLDKMAPDILDNMKKIYGDQADLYKAMEQRYAGIIRSRVSGTTEVSSYQFNKQQRTNKLFRRGVSTKKGAANVTKEWLGEAGEKVNDILETPSRFREEKLREGVGMTNFRDAISNGYTVEQAYTHARWTMDNATTNFGRSSYWWQNFTSSIPYANAAFNGFKSFNKMFVLDPAGITTRLFSGLILPAMYFTIQNLGSEENRKVYENLPEWERAGSLVIVMNGQAYSVPLPEQLTALISPWRQAVEMLYGANKAGFWKLALNNIFDYMPVDLTGFSGIDSEDLLASDDDFVSRYIKPGFSKAASSMLSPVEKSVVMLATGYDPYTNMPINPGYVALDEDGNAIITSSSATTLGQSISNLLGGNVSPGMAQKVLETLLGRANTGILDGITTLAKGVIDKDMKKAGQYIVSGLAESLSRPVTADAYNRTNSAFSAYVNVLKQDKAKMLSDVKLQEYIKVANNPSSSDDERKNAKARINDIVNDFYNNVLNLTNNYLKRTGAAGLTRNQFASILQLMNLETGGGSSSLLSPESSYLASLDSDQFKSGRASAIQTMADMGFSSISDSSIFGYYKKNSDGSYTVNYSDPISMLEYKYTDWQQKDIIDNRLQQATKDNDLYNKYQKIYNRLTPLYNSKDYNKVNELQLTWNGEVISAYKDVIDELTPEAVLSNNSAIDEIGRYMYVPYEYSKGSYLPNGGNKKRAYIREYVKYIYGVK